MDYEKVMDNLKVLKNSLDGIFGQTKRGDIDGGLEWQRKKKK